MISKKKLALAVGVIIFTGIIGGAYFYSQEPPKYEISINPMKLSPFVSPETARTTVCSAMQGQLYDEICQNKFDKVGKEDIEKIDELYSFIKKIEENNNISDYERLLLSQAAFASLPTKDSPLAQQSTLLELLSNFNNVAYAEEAEEFSGMGQEAFMRMMQEDLQKVVGDLPKGDNAWTINMIVSKHQWVNGVRQPIYSEHYGETYDPYPGVSTEDKSEWEQYDMAHVRSRVASYSSSAENSSDKISYSFSIVTWHSKKYTDSVLVLAEAGPGPKYLTSSHNFTENNYQGPDFLLDLLQAVEMPPLGQEDEDKDKPIPPPGTPLPYAEALRIGGTPGCVGWVNDPGIGLYCFDSFEQIEALVGNNIESGDDFKIGVLDLVHNMSPTYPYTDVEENQKKWEECIEQHGEDSYICDHI